MLLALAETPHQVWSRDALLERVWPNVIVGEEVLTHAIAEVRAGLGDDFRSPAFVETVYKHGYRLKCPVECPIVPPDEALCGSGDELSLHRYGAYLEACDLFERGGTRNVARAVSLFESITSAEPGFAPPRLEWPSPWLSSAPITAPGRRTSKRH